MIIPNDATIAVLDGASFRLFRNKGQEPTIELSEMAEPKFETENQGSGSRHHSSSANPDGSRIEEDNFAASAAGHLNRLALDGKMSAVVIVADPRTLGELRRHYHKALESLLAGELAKNLTGENVRAIEEALGKA